MKNETNSKLWQLWSTSCRYWLNWGQSKPKFSRLRFMCILAIVLTLPIAKLLKPHLWSNHMWAGTFFRNFRIEFEKYLLAMGRLSVQFYSWYVQASDSCSAPIFMAGLNAETRLVRKPSSIICDTGQHLTSHHFAPFGIIRKELGL